MKELKWYVVGKYQSNPSWVLLDVIGHKRMPAGLAQVRCEADNTWVAIIYGYEGGVKSFKNIEDAKTWAQTICRMK